MFSLDSQTVLHGQLKGASTSEGTATTALQLSAARGAERDVDYILAQDGGARIDAANKLGWTPLMFAARNGHAAIVRKLVAAGADPSRANRYGATVLSLAVASNDKPTIILVIHAVSKNVNTTSTNSPLVIASLFGNLATVELLLGYNCDPNASSALGFTPLMMASVMGNAVLTSLLLRVGANKYASNCSHQTALDMALLKDHDNIVDLLADQCNHFATLGGVATHFSPKSSILSSPAERISNREPMKSFKPIKTLFLDQCHPHVSEGHTLSSMPICCSTKSGMCSPTNRNVNVQPVQSFTSIKTLFTEQYVSKGQTLDRMPMHCSSKSGVCSPAKMSSVHSLTPQKTQQVGCSPRPEKITMHQLSPMSMSAVRRQENIVHSPSSFTTRSCSSNLPSSPLNEQTNDLRPFANDTLPFVLRSPSSPTRTKPDSTSSPSPRHNARDKKMYSPLRRGWNVYCVNHDKENVSTVRASPVESRWVPGGESSPRGNDRRPPGNTTTPDDVRDEPSYKARHPSLWKRLNNLASPVKRSYFRPCKEIVGVSSQVASMKSLETLLTMMDLEEYTQLFHTHELDVDTLLALNEKDLEDIGVDNETVRRSILDKISRVYSTTRKWHPET